MGDSCHYTVKHTHPNDGRHLQFFAKIKYENREQALEQSLPLDVDILQADVPDRLKQLRLLFITGYISAIKSFKEDNDKAQLLSLYLDAFEALLDELKAFYGEGIKSESTDHRHASSYSSRDVKVDYWLNGDLRFVYRATHLYDSMPVSFALGCLASMLVFPSVIITFFFQCLPLKYLFNHDGEDILSAKKEVQKRSLLESLIEETDVKSDPELTQNIRQRLGKD